MSGKGRTCVIVRSYDLSRDSRIFKIVEALTPLYEKVETVGWDRDGSQNGPGPIMYNRRAPYGKTFLLFLPLWWMFLFRMMIRKDWDVVHAINWDSVPPLLLVAKIRDKRIIYDIQDSYEDAVPLPAFVRRSFILFDRALMRFCDAITLVDDLQVQEFGGIPNTNFTVIYDSPPDVFGRGKEDWSSNGHLKMGFVGALHTDRRLNLEQMVQVVLEMDDVELTIAGYGDMEGQIRKEAEAHPDKVRYLGKIDFQKALQLLRGSDVTFVLRGADRPIYKFISGSTMVNAMMCGVPLIVNDGTATAVKVREYDCGIIVNVEDLSSVRSAVERLKDKKVRQEMGIRARQAYEQRYGWHIMRQRLIDLHQRMLR